jgi:hypothetical protein
MGNICNIELLLENDDDIIKLKTIIFKLNFIYNTKDLNKHEKILYINHIFNYYDKFILNLNTKYNQYYLNKNNKYENLKLEYISSLKEKYIEKYDYTKLIF